MIRFLCNGFNPFLSNYFLHSFAHEHDGHSKWVEPAMQVLYYMFCMQFTLNPIRVCAENQCETFASLRRGHESIWQHK